MRDFDYTRAADVNGALEGIRAAGAKFIAGGTNLLDLMKEGTERPERLVDINRISLSKVERMDDGKLRVGALVRNSDLAYHPEVESHYPLLNRAILAGASAQLRNMATTGGNLLQRTRCYYFYDVATKCNKRSPGEGCDAIKGVNRIHAILGTSDQCIATHPSDMCVAMAALEAVVHVTSAKGDRSISFGEFHRLPGTTPEIDTNLQPGELIVAIELPKKTFPKHFAYVKARDRNSYAFALTSAAVALEMDGDTIKEARFAMGGVAHRPWRRIEAEDVLRGAKATRENFEKAARVLLSGAKGFGHNDFKIQLGERTLVRALDEAKNQEQVRK